MFTVKRYLYFPLSVAVLLTFTFPPNALAKSKFENRKRSGVVYEEKTVRKTAYIRGIKWDLNVKKRYYSMALATLEKKNIKIDNDKQMVKRLNKIMNQLKDHSLIPNLPFEIHYVDHKTVNAVCYPGGGILVFKGLFDKKEGLVNPKKDDEIAAVLSHEIAHGTLRHAYKRNATRQGLGMIGSIITLGVGGAAGGSWGDLIGAFFDLGTGLYFPSYSRKQESEADLEGMFTMRGADYDPEVAITLWERASKKAGDKTSFFATHPHSSKRAQDLERHLVNLRAESVTSE